MYGTRNWSVRIFQNKDFLHISYVWPSKIVFNLIYQLHYLIQITILNNIFPSSYLIILCLYIIEDVYNMIIH